MDARLNTIMFYVRDIKVLRDFYVKNFNLKIIDEDDIWVLLNGGNINIAFHKIGKKYLGGVSKDHKFDNNVKIIFDIDISIETARDEFMQRNIQMREIKTFENYDYWLCDGIDPEGNVFQLKSKK
ncbi:VOC family protein [Flavobacterium sp. B17]|uniref:VOC family protein n=1 Tax=Flavobacterium sp. B17 TaxID=95618 RepID=UPI0005B275DA|nr:glyoxalase/bleomycin resistance/dioxygenase family protein [Flavobacterium sp. B17]